VQRHQLAAQAQQMPGPAAARPAQCQGSTDCSRAAFSARRASGALTSPADRSNAGAPSPWFERAIPPVGAEPGLELPCVARRGRVQSCSCRASCFWRCRSVSSRLDRQVAAARVPVSPLHHLGTIGFVPARRLRQPHRSLTGALPKDSPIPRNALAGGSAPLDLIGHAAHRFDSARRLAP
jgi:hypothetical protein